MSSRPDAGQTHPFANLPEPAAKREKLHTRTIVSEGFLRDDGIIDVDTWMTDVKTYSFGNTDRGELQAGEPLHSMGVRLSIDPFSREIVDCVAIMDLTPFAICPGIAERYAALKGIRVGSGFQQKVRDIVGGTGGCTHLGHLLPIAATTFLQTMAGKHIQKMKERQASGQLRKDADAGKRPGILDTCHSWASDSSVVKREMPEFYTGSDQVDTGAAK